MTPTLYFLRSSESKIVKDMTKYAHPDLEDNSIYSDFYGLTAKDLGLYALVDNVIAGAIWSRKLNAEHNATGFVDEQTPVLSIYVLPEFRAKGIGQSMMSQFLLEAGEVYEGVSISILDDEKIINFFEKFNFKRVENSHSIVMKKELEKKEIIRPTDGYDPTRWMD
ncbi:MAG: GNAT family N-acetyltransferase [Campylobacterota bacterium]|nr:GNAT family N-acetyltransferase [Campylobacterota bacterium]